MNFRSFLALSVLYVPLFNLSIVHGKNSEQSKFGSECRIQIPLRQVINTYYFPFDYSCYDGPISMTNITRYPSISIFIATARSYFIFQLLELLRLGYLEGVVGEFDPMNVHLKIALDDIAIYVDKKGAVKSVPSSLCNGFRMSEETLNKVHHHIMRYEGVQDIRMLKQLPE